MCFYQLIKIKILSTLLADQGSSGERKGVSRERRIVVEYQDPSKSSTEGGPSCEVQQKVRRF